MAERVGFEPTIPVKVCPLSRRIVSTTHAPLRTEKSSRQAMPLYLLRLASAPKKFLQNLCALACQHSARYLNTMVQRWMV